MLKLERKEGESIVLTLGNTTIQVTIDYAQYGKAKVGIDAPQEVDIKREELFSRVQADNEE